MQGVSSLWSLLTTGFIMLILYAHIFKFMNKTQCNTTPIQQLATHSFPVLPHFVMYKAARNKFAIEHKVEVD